MEHQSLRLLILLKTIALKPYLISKNALFAAENLSFSGKGCNMASVFTEISTASHLQMESKRKFVIHPMMFWIILWGKIVCVTLLPK